MRPFFPLVTGPPDESTESDAQLFRRNLLRIAAAHVLLLVVLTIPAAMRSKPVRETVTWLDGGALAASAAAAAEPIADQPDEAVEDDTEPEPEPESRVPEPPVPVPPVEAKSEIVQPKSTPAPATPKPATPKPATPKPAPPKPSTPKPATPKPTTPKPIAKTTPKPRAKATPAPTPVAKLLASVKPAAAATPPKSDSAKAAAEKAGDAKAATAGGAGSGTGTGKTGSGSGGMSQFGWYFEMIHDRFYSRWEQPVGLGQDVITTLKLRIMKDGAITSRTIVKPSGHAQMDESVLSAANKVEKIEPLPAGLGNGEFLDLNVNFKVGE